MAGQMDGKRGRPDGGWKGRSDAKRSKLCLGKGTRGIFVTTSSASKYVMQKALSEMDIILQHEVSALPPMGDSGPISDTSGGLDLEKQLEAEIAAVTKPPNRKRFHSIPDVTKGVGFVKFNQKEDDPSEIAHQILSAAKGGKGRSMKCRFVSRIIPAQDTCKPHPEEFKEMMRVFVADHFPQSAAAMSARVGSSEGSSNSGTTDDQTNPGNADSDAPEPKDSFPPEGVPSGQANPTWALFLTARQGMTTLSKDFVTKEVGALVGSSYKVNLGNPQCAILIEVNNMFCSVALCHDYMNLLRYNLFALCNPDQNTAATEQPSGNKETQKVQSEQEDDKS